MKKCFEKSFKTSSGITLIALVITIIVLLILAGISIAMLSGDNSILQKATDAKERTERASIIEQARTDILGQVAENKGENITKAQLVAVLNNYFETVSTSSIPNNISNTNDVPLTTIDEKYIINLSEIYSGNFTTTEEGRAYVIGDYVTINGEGFYVIEDSPANQTTVKLFAEKNVDTSTNKQNDNANAVMFDVSTAVYESSSIKTLVDLYVSQLGVGVIEKRLLTLNEMHTLGLVDEASGEAIPCPSFVIGNYWLMDVLDDSYIWTVTESDGLGYMEAFEPNNDQTFGVRPVIEILKNNITN